MPTLPTDWMTLVAAGVSHRIGSCSADGRPGICRALAADVDKAGQVLVLVAGEAGPDVLDAIRETGQVALVLALPQTHRTLHLKGRDGRVGPAGPEHESLLNARRVAFIRQLEPLGFTAEQLLKSWYSVRDGDLMCVRFTIAGAWNQSPGPGAGAAVGLVE